MKGILTFQALLVSCAAFAVCGAVNPECRVTTKSGEVQGVVLEARGGEKYCAFHGIPYAEYPGRFEVIKSSKNWTGVLNAEKAGSSCPQSAFGNSSVFFGNEDCLYMNVFYPIGKQCASETDKKHVFVHVHGGAFVYGSGASYRPDYIMADCIVYVSFNYRLGAFGFLTTFDDVLPGNLGLKDQVFALSWVRDNIENFGGDRDQVTIHGISAGSCSVSHLVISPSAKGLFHRAIGQSGSALNNWGITRNPDFWAKRLASALNCEEPLTSENIKTCLLTKTPEDIIKKQHAVGLWGREPIVSFGPVVESKDAVDPFHTQKPYDAYKKGEINAVPLMIGVVPDESLILQDLSILSQPSLTKSLDETWDKVLPTLLGYYSLNLPSEISDKFSKKIREFYFGNKSVGWENIRELTDMNSDKSMITGVALNAELHSRYAPTYRYLFNYTGDFSLLQLFNYTKSKLTHGNDAQYIMRIDEFGTRVKPGSVDEDFSKAYVNLFLSFVKTGVPSETWPKKNMWQPLYTQKNPNEWFELNSECQVKNDYHSEGLNFWKNLGLEDYEFGSKVCSCL